jgi:heterodisulfide reductase subunit C
MPDAGKAAPPKPPSEALAAELGRLAAKCFSCKKCSAGCPVAAWADLLPHRLVRLAQTGQVERLGASRMLWLCASCQACATRCPHGVELPRLAALVRAWSLAAGKPVAEPRVAEFHRAFLRSLRRTGRVNEAELLARYKLAAGGLFDDLDLGWKMLRAGKLHAFGKRPGRAVRRTVRRLVERSGGGERQK